ncbi:sulfite exporter TauE/SafE family protein [Geopsychrobacter electrodiphilus]|uniref:sulfite exporter TauE/SafE family protein n=1 Tax=Geopsychrobacter electrodiphilus TaxID=225196 RepID=UPI00037D48BB|nr:sulfite exporter TauE/SafE family protein [Geopsychrobacter electrodiphilus]
MDTELLNQLIIPLFAFGLSFVFALGGVGSAIALVPALSWLEVPLLIAKPTGLLVNTLSMTGASVSNIRAKRLDFRLGVPIIISSFLLAPLGAWSTRWIPMPMVLAVFTLFLLFSGLILIFFRAGKFEGQFREDRPILAPALIGAVAGYLSGLLGVGGGGLIAPLMIMLGFNPKKVAVITAFVVPFSSLSGLIAYLVMGYADLRLMIPAAVAAFIGGVLGTRVMQAKLKPVTVKKFLGGLLLLLALKMGMQLFG